MRRIPISAHRDLFGSPITAWVNRARPLLFAVRDVSGAAALRIGILSLLAGLSIIVGATPVRTCLATEWIVFPGQRYVAPGGRYYVVARRQDEPILRDAVGPVIFRFVLRSSLAKPVRPAEARVQTFEDPESGLPIYKVDPEPVRARPEDTVLAELRRPFPPWKVLVSARGFGVVLIDRHGPNWELISREQPAVEVFCYRGHRIFSWSLKQVFSSEEISRFCRFEGERIDWLEDAWIDDIHGWLVVVGQQFDPKDAAMGPCDDPREPVVRAFDLGNGKQIRDWQAVLRLELGSADRLVVEPALRATVTTSVGGVRNVLELIAADPRRDDYCRALAAVALAQRGDASHADLVDAWLKRAAVTGSEKRRYFVLRFADYPLGQKAFAHILKFVAEFYFAPRLRQPFVRQGAVAREWLRKQLKNKDLRTREAAGWILKSLERHR